LRLAEAAVDREAGGRRSIVSRAHPPLLANPHARDARLGVRDGVYRACLAAIRDGRLAEGARLPSSRQLATDWHVSRNTVDAALAQLQDEGLIVRRVGSGTFVARGFSVPASAAAACRRPPAALGRRALAAASSRGVAAAKPFLARSVPRAEPFVAGMAALDAFPLAQWRRLAGRAGSVHGAALLAYLPASGYPPLQSAIADHLATSRGIRCEPGQVMVVTSTMQAIDLIARVLAERDDTALIEDPCYPNLRAVLAASGLRATTVAVDAEGAAIDDRLRAAGPAAALMCVTPSCHYPTGTVMTLARRLAVLEAARRAGAWIVEDDHQVEFTWSGRPPPPIFALDRGGRTLYVNTFSATLFPSLRLAFVVLPTGLVDVFHAVRRQLDDHTHGFMQAVLADFIGGGHFAAHLRSMRRLYASRRDALIDACARELPDRFVLAGLACGMHATLQLPADIADDRAAVHASRAGIRVLPLSRYAARPSTCNGLLLGYSALGERRIVLAIRRLADAIRDPPASRRHRVTTSAG
jgi:GntR family transcriptional regulator/MocR family aminotransferase